MRHEENEKSIIYIELSIIYCSSYICCFFFKYGSNQKLKKKLDKKKRKLAFNLKASQDWWMN